MNLFLQLLIIPYILIGVNSEKKVVSVVIKRITIGNTNLEAKIIDLHITTSNGQTILIHEFPIQNSTANTTLDYPLPQFSFILDLSKTKSIIMNPRNSDRFFDIFFKYTFKDDSDFFLTFVTYENMLEVIRYDIRIICSKMQKIYQHESFTISFFEKNNEMVVYGNTRNFVAYIDIISIDINGLNDIINCDYIKLIDGEFHTRYSFFFQCIATKRFFEIKNPKIITFNLLCQFVQDFRGFADIFPFKFNLLNLTSNKYIILINDIGNEFNFLTNYKKLFNQNDKINKSYNSSKALFVDLSYDKTVVSCKNGHVCEIRNNTEFCKCVVFTYGDIISSNMYTNSSQNVTVSTNSFVAKCKNYPSRTIHSNATCFYFNKCVNGMCHIYKNTPLCKCNSSFTGYYCEIDCASKCVSAKCTQTNDKLICFANDYITTPVTTTTTTTSTSTTTATTKTTSIKKSNTYNMPNSAKIFLLIYICLLFASSTVTILVFVLWKYLITKKSYYFNYQPEMSSNNTSKALPTIENIKSKIKTKLVVRDEPTSIFRA